MKREFQIKENKINEMIQKNMKESRDIERIISEIHEGYFIIKLRMNFPTNPVICIEIIPEKMWEENDIYKMLLRKRRKIYIENMPENALGPGLSGEKLDAFAEMKLNETGFFTVQGADITMGIEKTSELGAYADLAPDLVRKAISTSRLICKEAELIIETEVSDWDIKAAILKNPGAIGNLFANGIKDKGIF